MHNLTTPGIIAYDPFTLAPGEAHMFVASFIPSQDMVGSAHLWAAFLTGDASAGICCDTPIYLTGVTPVAVTILSADPVDTSSGSWTVAMSADATTVHVGGSVGVHARVRNVGTGKQATSGYGSLGISCKGRAPDSPGAGVFIGGKPFAIGEERTFTYEFRPDDRFVGAVTCTFGIGYHGAADYAAPGRHTQVDEVHLTVLPPEPATTVPAVTTSTTTP